MHLLMEFELNHEEIAQIISLQAELEAEFFRIPSITPPSYRNDFFSDIQEKISAVYSKARERSLKYYASHTAELVTALKGETKNIIVCILEIEAEQRKPIEFWKERTISTLSPYLSLLDNAGREQIMRDIDYVFEHKEEIYREAQRQKKQRGRTGYAKMLNGPGLNNGLRASKRRMTRTEKITSTGLENIGEQVIGGILVGLSNFDRVNLTDNTRKILHILTIKLTDNVPYGANITAEQIAKARAVALSLDEYMSFCGLTDRKEALKQLRNNAYTLFNLYATWDEPGYVVDANTGRKKRKKIHWNTRLFDTTREIMNLDKDPVTDSEITFFFSFDLVRYLCQKYIMPFNLLALSINPHNHPHGYTLAFKLMEHYNENIIKHKNIRSSVEALLKACPEMPTPEEVKEFAKSKYWERIREPFERTLNALRDEYGIIEEWHYCNPGGEPLTDEQQTKCKVKDWLQWLVEFTLTDYPDQSERRAEAKRRKRNSKPKAIALPAKTE